MGKETAIAWCDATYNPWWGCTRVSPGCEKCYAETFSKRVGLKVWGAQAERRRFGDKHWAEPLKWNRDAAKAGERRRVFCASMADVFEDRRDLDGERARLWTLIEETPWLDWLLLTKRPENRDLVPLAWQTGSRRPGNVWLGCTAENQEYAERRIPHVLEATWAAVKFVSYEPALGPVDLRRWLTTREPITRFEAFTPEAKAAYPEAPGVLVRSGIDWVIVGGESGPGARPFKAGWTRDVIRQCRQAGGVACFVKQMGANVRDRNDVGFHGGMGDEFENEWPDHLAMEDRVEHNPNGFREEYQGAPVRIRLHDAKGGDMDEWPADLRVREFPTPRLP